jgi:FMN phosphatase YigB (HAD superfamily)
MKPTHLFIDLDGTLLASHKLRLQWDFVRHAARHLKNEYGLHFFEAFKLIHKMRLAIERGDKEVVNELRVGRVFKEKFSLSDEQGLERARAMAGSVFSELSSHFEPIPGALEFIQWASSRYHLTLATNPVWPRAVVLKRLGWAGIGERYFQMISTAETMHFCKPHLGYYREMLLQMKVQNNTVLMIGDSEKKDLPALKVGIPVFLLKPNGFKRKSEGFMTGNFEALKNYLESSSQSPPESSIHA